MSFIQNRGNKNKVNYKARFEHKLYLARISPSTVYDISECNLENVPSSTYKLCEVFRKDILLMQCNKLRSLSGGGALKYLYLITVLDIHSNELNNLPSDIVHLISLKELYLQDNNFNKLPNEIINLKNLSILDISRNKLKNLPEAMGNLKNLVSLNISYNKHLQMLPKSLGYAQKITNLEIDGLKLCYPSEDVQNGGTIMIIAFLAKECGIIYSPKHCTPKAEAVNNTNFTNKNGLSYNKDNNVQAALMKLKKLKEDRQTALLEVEENIKQQQLQEIEMQSNLKLSKQKLLNDLVHQQNQLEKEFEKIQKQKELNRSRLLSCIYNAEKEADKVIKEFLNNSEKARLTQTQLLEIEKKEEMRILSQSHSQQSLHRTKDILLSMKNLLEEELLKEKKLVDYTSFRDFNAQSLLSLELKNNNELLQVMQDQEKNRQDLVIRLKEDEQLQKAVVAALLERSDTRSWSIVQQVNLVQSQLAALTKIELERRKLEINQQINDVADKRVTLSAILLELLQQQENRRHQLFQTVKHIEEQHNNLEPSKQNSFFWILQYQNLIEFRPQGLLETLDSDLVHHIAMAGALHCLPFLSTLPTLLPNLEVEQLISIGIENENDRAAIMAAIENYLTKKKQNYYEYCIPSAPLKEEVCLNSSELKSEFQPSAPTECIICMDSDCEIIFLPCGHLCCCVICTDMLSAECPMCRAHIDHKIKVTKQ